jgi:hypothetical protein
MIIIGGLRCINPILVVNYGPVMLGKLSAWQDGYTDDEIMED